VGGPALIELGVPPLAAHLFVFYLAILSAVTPPVCGAVFIASGMAEANWIDTAKIGLKLSFAAFLIPFLFVYDPSLVLIGSPVSTIQSLARSAMALICLSAGIMGYFRLVLRTPLRVGLIIAGTMLLIPGSLNNLIGLLMAVLLWFYTGRKKEVFLNAIKP